MSDFDRAVIEEMNRQAHQMERLGGDIPAIYLPWTQRILNPFPLASSNTTFADMPQPWDNRPLAFYVSILVNTTNNVGNYWTINLQTVNNSAATVVASIRTDSPLLTANTAYRSSDLTVNAPASGDMWYRILPVATGSPGSVFIWPAVALLRTGN